MKCVPPNPPLQRSSNFDEETTAHNKETNSTSITITTHKNLLLLLLSTPHCCNPVAISACYSHHPSPSFHVLGATIITPFPCSLCSITTHPGSSFVLGAAAAEDTLAISALLFPLPITQFPCSWCGITSHPGSFVLGAAVAANPLAISASYSHHPSPSFHVLGAPSSPTQVSLFLVLQQQQQGFQACLSDTSNSRFYYSQGKSAMTITTTNMLLLQQQQQETVGKNQEPNNLKPPISSEENEGVRRRCLKESQEK